MALGRPSLRILAALVASVVPPLVAFAAVIDLAPGLVTRMGLGTMLLLATGVGLLWAGGVAVVASRMMSAEAESMVRLAERGVVATPAGTASDEYEGLSVVQRRLAASLDERNRQIAALADLVRTAPIADPASRVAAAMVRGARSLTDDPTWTLAVVRSDEPDELGPGVYGPDPDDPPMPLEEVHRWGATTEEGAETGGTARVAVGPWGAFAIIDMAVSDDVHALLMAPWEGRPAASPADLRLFSLLGRHAATTIEHARLYARLRHQTDELNRMARVQADFLRGVTHDLQTPLTSIGVLASELRDSGDLDGAALDDLEIIMRQADRLRRMVGQLLAVSRLEAGAMTPRQEVFGAWPIIERTWEALHAVDHRLEFSVEGPQHLLVGDEDRLEQVLWALMDNAVKYSPAGSPVRVNVSSVPDTPGTDDLVATITISDEGAGMDASALAHAFDQFYRAEDAKRMAPDGSGIGLYAARGLVEAMGGSISLESRAGVGTTVQVRLQAERADVPDDSSVPSQEPPPVLRP